MAIDPSRSAPSRPDQHKTRRKPAQVTMDTNPGENHPINRCEISIMMRSVWLYTACPCTPASWKPSCRMEEEMIACTAPSNRPPTPARQLVHHQTSRTGHPVPPSRQSSKHQWAQIPRFAVPADAGRSWVALAQGLGRLGLVDVLAGALVNCQLPSGCSLHWP